MQHPPPEFRLASTAGPSSSMNGNLGPFSPLRPGSSVYENSVVDQQISATRNQLLVNSSELSKVLILYTGGTIGMKNHDMHGYRPAAGFLSEMLRSMRRFHDVDAIPIEDYVPNGSTATAQQALDSAFVNKVNLPLRYRTVESTANASATASNSSLSEGFTVSVEGRRQPQNEPSIVVNGTPVIRAKLPAMISPVSLYGKRIKFSVLEYDPLMDSSNMTMDDWVKIATDIEVNYELFDAFLVLHGTDTMSYTASALSFMLEDLGKTVILTGSQVPLAEIRNDAVENLLGALTIAGHFVIPEVSLFFAHKLYRGNRSSKVDAYDFKAFDSPNIRPLVSVGINIDVAWSEVLRPTHIAKFRAEKRLISSVAALRIFPGITEATVRAFLSPPIAGVVLETYGSGNAPNNRPEILAALKEASDRGVIIVNCTQCRKGLVTDLYATGKALLRIGVVPGGDMTTECALTKLSYVLGKGLSPEECRDLMRSNLRGEITVMPQKPKFTNSTKTIGLVQSIVATLGKSSTANSSSAAPTAATNSVSSSTTAIAANGSQPTNAPLRIDPTAPSASNGSPNSSPPSSSGGVNGSGPTPRKRPRSPSSARSGLADYYQLVEEIDGISLERMVVPMLLGNAIRTGDLDTLALIATEYEALVSVGDYDSRTPLHVAASENQWAAAEKLLQHGANVHLRDRFGHTPLYDAVRCGHVQVAMLLREAGAHFSEDEGKDVAALVASASADGNLALVKLLCQCGVDMNVPLVDGRTSVHLAISGYHLSILQFYIEQNARVLQLSRDGSSPQSPSTGIEIRFDIRDNYGRTPMDDAKSRGWKEGMECLAVAIQAARKK
ncbi:asparaginase-domain-containing protein [Zopfochytrium polystomum]|nr:asparaginase-domain-containing protein [Zopfochytrium polystomum]